MWTSLWLDEATCSRVAVVLWQVTWSGTILSMLGAVVARWATQTASVRYSIHCGTLTGMLALIPAWGMITSPPSDGFPRAPLHDTTRSVATPASVAVGVSATAVAPDTPLPRNASAPVPSLVPPAESQTSNRPANGASSITELVVRGVTIGYVVGLVAMLARLVVGAWGAERLRSTGRFVDDREMLALMSRLARQLGLRVVPLLRVCDRIAAPVVVGLLRPVVLVPTSVLTGLSPDQLSVVLMHELAHLRRHDSILLLGQRFAEAVLFFHPAVWYLSRQIDQVREDACDDLVLAQGGDALEYARSLVRVAELRLGPTAPLSALSVEGANPSMLRRRIARVLGQEKAPVMRLTPTGVAALLLSLVGAASLPLALAESDDEPSESKRVSLEFRLVVQPPDGKLTPRAPFDWRTRTFRRTTDADSDKAVAPAFVWSPLAKKDARTDDERLLRNLPIRMTSEETSFSLLSDQAGEVLLDDGSWKIVSASVVEGQDGPELQVEFDVAGGKALGELTSRNIGASLAIIMGGRIVMVPTIRTSIGAKFVITGAFTLQECQELVKRLLIPTAKPATSPVQGHIEGQVVTSEGIGIAGAEVAVTTEGNHGVPVMILAIATADATGGFRIPVTAKLFSSRQSVGIWARADGFVPQRDKSTTFIKHLMTEQTKIRLHAAIATTIALLDKDRRPAENAWIQISHVQVEQGIAYRFPDPWLRDFEAQTDAKGHVTIRNITPETVRQFNVTLPSGALMRFDQNYFLNEKPAEQVPHFTIPALDVGFVDGTFQMAGSGDSVPPPFAPLVGAPNASAEPINVSLMTEVLRPPFGTWVGISGVKTITLQDTHFRAPMVPGRLTITTSLTANQPWQLQIPDRLMVRAGETLPVSIPLHKGVKVRGLIRKRDTKDGIGKYGLTLIYGPSARDVNDRTHSVELTTDENGAFAAYVPAGPVRIQLNRHAKGYREVEDWNDGPWNHRDKPLVVPAEAQEFDLPPINFDPTIRIRGTLVDAEGKPLTDWSVYGFPTEWDEQYDGQKEPKSFVMNSFPGVHTDRDGKFENDVPRSYPPGRWRVSRRVWPTKFDFEDETYIPRIRSRDPLILEVDVRAGPVKSEEDRHQDNEVVEELPNQASVQPTNASSDTDPAPLLNRVVDAQGREIAGATIEFHRSFKYAWTETPPPIARLTADAQGRFAYPLQLRDEAYFVVYVSANGFLTRAWTGHRDAYRTADGRLRPDTLSLHRPATVSGRVLDIDGRPLANADVAVDYYFEDGPSRINGNLATTDVDGRFTAIDVPPGHVFVRHQPCSTTNGERVSVGVQTARFNAVHLQPADGENVNGVVLDLRQCRGVAAGVIVDENGKGVAGREIRAVPTAAYGQLDEAITCKSDERGRFRFEGLAPGEYTFEPFGPDSSVRAQITLNGPTDLTLKTYRAGSKPKPTTPDHLEWGEATDEGLVAAVRFEPALEAYSPGETVTVMAVVRNTSSQRRLLKYIASEHSQLQVWNDQSNVMHRFDYGNFTGWPYTATYLLEPGEEAVVSSFPIGLVDKKMGKTLPLRSLFQIDCEPGQRIPVKIELSAKVSGRSNADEPPGAFATGKAILSVTKR